MEEESLMEQVWADFLTATDLILKASRCTTQVTGHSIGLTVTGARNLWLGLTSRTKKRERCSITLSQLKASLA